MHPEQTPLLTVPEAAAILRVSERYLRRQVAEGHLAHYRVGRHLKFAQADLEAWLEGRRRDAEVRA